MVFNRDLKHYENFTLISHFVAQPAEMTHLRVGFDSSVEVTLTSYYGGIATKLGQKNRWCKS